MEALLVYRAGTKPSRITTPLKYENLHIQEVLWTPNFTIDLLTKEPKPVLIYLDHDKKLLAVAQALKKASPQTSIFLFDDEVSEQAHKLHQEEIVDCYFTLPYDFAACSGTIKKVIISKHEAAGDSELSAESFLLDIHRRCISRDEKIIHLRNKEFELLEFLILNKDKLVTRTALLEHVWDRNGKFKSNTLDVHIGRLRRKLDYPFKKKYIHTIHSIGYRFDSGTQQ